MRVLLLKDVSLQNAVFSVISFFINKLVKRETAALSVAVFVDAAGPGAVGGEPPEGHAGHHQRGRQEDIR